MGRLVLAAACVLGLVCIANAAAPRAGNLSPLFPFQFLKRSLSESERQARESNDRLQEEIQNVVEKISAAARSDSDLSRRENVAFGLGGTCGNYNDSCSYAKTHCCGELTCTRDRWYHVRGVCM
ncbi:uncharacterized protein LOC124271697 [Haliotis rubra]|uniref:uncharacterized protein LOC124271697 n=1 Tax=Haliotis rubra TaxID=36100 RepID=UPI001EE56901|nr:uncharacterized protein LOC124271697 [Haliotis rubra]